MIRLFGQYALRFKDVPGIISINEYQKVLNLLYEHYNPIGIGGVGYEYGLSSDGGQIFWKDTIEEKVGDRYNPSWARRIDMRLIDPVSNLMILDFENGGRVIVFYLVLRVVVMKYIF